MPYNFVADSLHTKKLCSRPSSSEVRFRQKTAVLRFWAALWGLRRNIRWSSYAHWKACSGLLLVLIELFSLGVTAEVLWANIGSKSAISLQRGRLTQNVRRVAPINHSSSQKTRLNDLSYGITMWTDLSSVLSQCMPLTDRQTDRQKSHR